jgi:hypothetical protein
MPKSTPQLFERLQKEQQELQLMVVAKNDARRRAFKSWYGRNVWLLYTAHTTGMNPQPSLVDWMDKKRHEDLYRGSGLDNATSNQGDHSYGDAVRLGWAVLILRVALSIILDDTRRMYAVSRAGRPVYGNDVIVLVQQLIDEALEHMIALHQPDSEFGLNCSIELPKGTLITTGIDRLQTENMSFRFRIARRRKMA